MIFTGLLVFSLVVFVHELGHFIAMKVCGVPIKSFSVGFGPRIVGFNWRGTEIKLSLFMVGGYVNYMSEEVVKYLMTKSQQVKLQQECPHLFDKSRWFENRGALVRLFGVAAGPLANILFAFGICIGLLASGQALPISGPPQVTDVVRDSNAYMSGLRDGDQILSVDGNVADNIFETRLAIIEGLLRPSGVSVLVQDEFGQKRSITLRGNFEDFYIDRFQVPANLTVPQTVRYSGQFIGEIVDRNVEVLMNIVDQAFNKSTIQPEESSADSVSSDQGIVKTEPAHDSSTRLMGPIGIARLTGEIIRRDPNQFLIVTILLNCSLAIFNIIPIPPLDGFQMIKISLESIFGRRCSPFLNTFFAVFGVLLLFTLLAKATWNDLTI